MYPQRSVLSVPGSRPDMIEKALLSEADLVFIDLEDAVATDLKAESRYHVVAAFRDADWRGRPRAYRVNALDTPYFYRDLIDVVEAVGDRVDLVVVPKVERAADIAVIETLLRQLEAVTGRREPIRLHVQIETARGVLFCAEIAGASTRLDGLSFGPGDFAASMQFPARAIGVPDEWDELHGGNRFGFAMHQVLLAARTFGLAALDGPYAAFRDIDGLRQASLLARALGFDGKWCIHPAQVPVVNDVFTPTDDEIRWAREVLERYQEAQAAGSGALAFRSTMLDAASLRMAERTLARARVAGRMT